MKKYRIRFCLFYLIIIVLILYVNCEIDKNAYKNEEFVFPEIDYIDSNVYDEIKITCETYWNLSDMIDSTFKIIEYEDGYSIHCDGYLDSQLYHYAIRTDKNGKWINDSRTAILSNEYRDITQMCSVQNFETIKNFILKNGDKQTYCNMYNNNPHFAYSYFNVYLNPEIGQANINCDPEISDFNEIVIRDQNSDPQYYYLHIVRLGDLENEQINMRYSDLKEDRVYLLNYHENDLNTMEDNVQIYIDIMKREIKLLLSKIENS